MALLPGSRPFLKLEGNLGLNYSWKFIFSGIIVVIDGKRILKGNFL
jgi:hypothetical protein